MADGRGRYAQRIKWNPEKGEDYPVPPGQSEELVDFIERWLKAAVLPNGYIHPDDVAELIINLPAAVDWLDAELSTYGAAALSTKEVDLLWRLGIDLDKLKQLALDGAIEWRHFDA